MADAAEALDFLSQRHNLLHLDIKPENLLVLGDHIKVADFGLVKELASRTQNSLVSGMTPTYASPEMFDDEPTAHSDQYSLAIVYQEMLVGTLPFPGRTAAQLAKQHTQAEPQLMSLPAEDRPVIGRGTGQEADRSLSFVPGVCRRAASAEAPTARRRGAAADSRQSVADRAQRGGHETALVLHDAPPRAGTVARSVGTDGHAAGGARGSAGRSVAPCRQRRGAGRAVRARGIGRRRRAGDRTAACGASSRRCTWRSAAWEFRRSAGSAR